MYLRLKHHHPTGFAEIWQMSRGMPDLASLRQELLHRHYTAFDWQNGGPPGPIKFVDVHQLELAGLLAHAGDDRARLMIKHYVRGIEQLVTVPGSGAAHYATGPAWNTPCRTRTLAGQAVVIQALVIAGRLSRSSAHARVVPDLARFAAARWFDTAIGDTRATTSLDNPASPCELAWYVSALTTFAELYDSAQLRVAAHRAFNQLADLFRTHDGESLRSTADLTLADRVAVATLASEFSSASRDVEVAHFARRILVESAHRHAHPAGGWIQEYRDGAPPDLDCSVDLIRTADALHARDEPELARLAAEGKRSLFKPEFALARTPESGLLLLLTDASGNSAPRGTDVPAPERKSRFRRDYDKLLVNVRK